MLPIGHTINHPFVFPCCYSKFSQLSSSKNFCFSPARSKAHSGLWDWATKGTESSLRRFFLKIYFFFLKVLNYIQPNSTLKTLSNPLFPILLPCFCDFIHLTLYTYLLAFLWWGFCTLSFVLAWWNQPYKPTAITNNCCAPVLHLGRTEQGVQNTILKKVYIQA